MEQYPQQEEMYVDYKELKANMLNGEVDLKQIKERLLQADQSTLSREASYSNLEFLVDKETISFIEKQDTEIQRSYYGFLSFTYLHVAQNEVFKGNADEGLEKFRNAFVCELKGLAHPDNIAYKRGSIAYLEKDIGTLEDSIDRLEEGRNKEILINMLEGLKTRGYPDYLADYSK